MRNLVSSLFLICACSGSNVAWSQPAMLAPPDNHYFVSKGSWGQDYPDQWALQRIGFDSSPESAWRLVRRDAKPVTVAVIDTGLDWYHRNIAPDQLWHDAKDDAIGWDFFDNDNKPWDYDGHGTMVSGIIAADWNDKAGMAGVNPFARLMVLKAINSFGHSRASYLAEAIAYAADHGARVLNLSVGGKQITKVEQAAVDYAFSKGAVIVVAAGNDGENIHNYGIVGSDKVLTVASTGFDDQRVVFSNWGGISVAAPGLDVLGLRARRTDLMLGIEDVKYTAGAAYVGRRQATLSRERDLVFGAVRQRSRIAHDCPGSQPDESSGDEHRQEHGARCRNPWGRSIHRIRHHRRACGAQGTKGLLPVCEHRAGRGDSEGWQPGGASPRHGRRQFPQVGTHRGRPRRGTDKLDPDRRGAKRGRAGFAARGHPRSVFRGSHGLADSRDRRAQRWLVEGSSFQVVARVRHWRETVHVLSENAVDRGGMGLEQAGRPRTRSLTLATLAICLRIAFS